MSPLQTPLLPQPDKPDGPYWLLLCVALGLFSLAFSLLRVRGLLFWRADDGWQHAWTLWTASLVHLSRVHLLANLAALIVLAVLGHALSANRWTTLAVLVAWPLSTWALRLWPTEVFAYAGMSGLLCAIAAALWAHAAVREQQKVVSYLLLAGMLLKLGTERAWAHPIAFDPVWGFNVVYAAHLCGAVAGAVIGLCAQLAPAHYMRLARDG